MKLTEAKLHHTYQIKEIEASKQFGYHLKNLGLVKEAHVVLLRRNDKDGILSIQNSRVAVNRSVLEQIDVIEVASSKILRSLDQLQVGETAFVAGVLGQGSVRRRLMDMGLTKKTSLYVKKLAPLGDPMEISIRGYTLTLRKEEAAYIVVEQEENA